MRVMRTSWCHPRCSRFIWFISFIPLMRRRPALRPGRLFMPALDRRRRASGGAVQRRVAGLPALRVDQRTIPDRAVLQGAPLGLVVDVDDAEALGVAGVPLEVVEQAPQEITLHVDALRDGGGQRLQ